MAAGNDPTVRLAREYDAPRELVFEAWSKREHLEKWFGPDGFTTHVTLDFRPGGAFVLRLVGMGFDNTTRGSYREIVKPERIVWESRFEDVPELEVVTTVTFEARGPKKTALTVVQEFPGWETLAAPELEMMRPRWAGAPIGWGQTLDHLGAYVSAR